MKLGLDETMSQSLESRLPQLKNMYNLEVWVRTFQTYFAFSEIGFVEFIDIYL